MSLELSQLLSAVVSYPETLTILKLLASAAMMFVLGAERQKQRKFMGPRTVMLIGCASTLFSTMALQFDAVFILGGIITGVGFLGGGVITKERGKVHGLTTASLVWMAATIGICVGLGLYVTAVFATVFSYAVLRAKDKLRVS
ncbi:MAG: MgtC/SapB family protein [Candidatus Aenigmarchaeota archaeon]|nr:MgtC/SapB family protein [Candidatus Aenigmarchaeota archaeon]